MNTPLITTDNTVPVYESRFLKVFDLQYKKDAHYYDATRRDKDNIVAIKSEDEFRNMLPDAVTIAVIVKTGDNREPRLLLSREYRYPVGRFLLSPPAGLIDPEDMDKEQPLIETAKREILEETGLVVSDTDTIKIVNPCLFSTPGMTDESNAIVMAVLDNVDLASLNQDGAVGSEMFDGNILLSKKEAARILKDGRDSHDYFYPAYTWIVLMCFVSDLWE